MARKLPWATSTSTNKPSTAIRPLPDTRPAKRAKLESDIASNAVQEGNRRLRSETAHPNDDATPWSRARDGRSPSTSPPLAPPVIELMRPGFDEDDAYMMVEDEFQAVAQSYTAHLHHAEYKRLMKLAKEKKKKRQQQEAEQLKRGELSRVGKLPGDASGEIKQGLRAMSLKARQSSGSDKLCGRSLLNESDGQGQDGGDGDDEEEEAEAREAVLVREEKIVGDMWAGTALARLMNWDHSQEKTSLKGLDAIGGETRASKGPGPSGKTKTDNNTLDESLRVKGAEGKNTNGVGATQKPVQDSMDGTRVANTSAMVNKDTARRFEDATSPVKPVTEGTKAKRVMAGKYRNLIDFLGDFDDAAFDATQAKEQSDPPEKPKIRLSKDKIREKKEKDKKDRLDEVPVFSF